MSALAVPITEIELAMVSRLKTGLGRMVTAVETYGGEFDEDLSTVVRRFPGVWVTFGGVNKTTPIDTSKQKWLAQGLFVVMVGCRSIRSEAAGRHGGPGLAEVGTNMLIYAVRRLLTQQDLDLPIEAFAPGAIKTLFNTKTSNGAYSVFALEFHTSWVERALPNEEWPQPVPDVDDDPDKIFADYAGATSPPPGMLEGVSLKYYLAPKSISDVPDAQNNLTLGGSDES